MTQTKDEAFLLLLRNLIWTCEGFNFTVDDTLKWINRGMLGYELDRKGNPKMDTNNKPMPITISRKTYFRYKKQFTEMPEVYNDLKTFAAQKYSQMVLAFQEELAKLHEMSAKNLLSVTDPLERQQVIESMVKWIIPTQAAFADMLRKMTTRGLIIPQEKKEQNGTNDKDP